MAKESEYGVADALPPTTRGGNPGAYLRFTEAAEANPGKWVTFPGLNPKGVGQIVSALRKRGFDAAQRGGGLYVKQGDS